MWAHQGGPDGRLRPEDHAAFIRDWTAAFLEMDREEYVATGPTVRRGPPLRKHPEDMTTQEMRAALDGRPWLWTPHPDGGGSSCNLAAARTALIVEYEAAHG